MSVPDVDPAEFARAVRETPDDALAEGMASENRGLILDEIFRRMEEHFDPQAGAGVDAVMDWKIWDRPDGGYDHYRVHISAGSLRVDKDPPEGGPEPRVTFRVKPVTFLRLVTGNASGPQLFLTGKLKIDGDVMFAARVQSLFAIPKG